MELLYCNIQLFFGGIILWLRHFVEGWIILYTLIGVQIVEQLGKFIKALVITKPLVPIENHLENTSQKL